MYDVIISKGNIKLGGIPNVSMSPIVACGNCQSCQSQCYARSSYLRFEHVRFAWDSNFNLAISNSSKYFDAISTFLTDKNPELFRWHVAGDILDQSYLNNMVSLAEEHTSTKFLAFTKMFQLDFSSCTDNLSIVWSMWPDMKKPRIKKGVSGFAWMQNGFESRVPEIAYECIGKCVECRVCFSLRDYGGHVLFHKH